MNLNFSWPRRFLVVFATIAAISILLGTGVRAAYDSPNFDSVPFDPDALSLDERAVEEVVAALTALAINFSTQEKVDDDLREKALAIALSLDPLDGSARIAHAALSEGKSVSPVEFFSTLNALSAALWRHGEKLAAPDAEPEDHKLAPFLLELALLTGDPQPDQLRVFGRITGLKPVDWGSLVRLQGSAYESNRRALYLIREAEKFSKSSSGAKDSGAPVPGKTPPNGNPPPGTNPGPSPGGGGSVAAIRKLQPVLRYIAYDRDSGAIPGEARLNIRKPREDERSLFGLFLGTEGGKRDSFVMRLGWDRDGPTITGYEDAGELIKTAYPNWPKDRIAEFTFAAAGGKRPSQVEMGLPCALLLESAFSGKEIAPDVAIAGNLTSDQTLELPTSTADLVRAAGIGDGAVVKVLLIPAEGETSLTDAVTAGDLSVLVRPQVVAVSSFKEARELAFGPRPERLTEALQKFGEIQNLNVQGMPLDELSKNNAVQERLRAIRKLWPGHLSAKLMLAFGVQPVDTHLSEKGSVGQIDAALKPVIKHYTDSVFGGGTVVGAAQKLIDKARDDLRALREKVNPNARPCLNSAETLIETFDDYFSLTNKSSSRASQIRRELQESINTLNSQRSQLGGSGNLTL